VSAIIKKRDRENFKQLVHDCTCPERVLTIVRIEKFAARARASICTYHHFEQQKQEAATQNSDDNKPTQQPKQEELLYSEIERLTKAFKGHRCALDFDRDFIHSELKEATAKKEAEQ
jgi:hypothetical protein